MAQPNVEAKEAPKRSRKTHQFIVNGNTFTVDRIYSPIKPIGTGAYGVVCSALDLTTNKKVAIKKITNVFDDLIDAKRILREIKVLRHFRHDNVCNLLDLTNPSYSTKFEDIYMVLDYMETDMHKIIYSKNELTDDHVQFFIYQILAGLKYIHSANVIHRDLKPSNLLLNSNCELKICDYGLARGIDTEVDYNLTEYVVTRWYRAPEIMCSLQDYDAKIDVWSVGCIFAEILGRKPLFPGDDYIHQMNLIFQVLGTPSEDDMDFITNKKAKQYILDLKKLPKVKWDKIFKRANPLALDLLDKMLAFNPHKRVSVTEALEHPYLKQFHNPEKELACESMFNFDFEKYELTKENLQKLMFEEVLAFRPELKNDLPSPK